MGPVVSVPERDNLHLRASGSAEFVSTPLFQCGFKKKKFVIFGMFFEMSPGRVEV